MDTLLHRLSGKIKGVIQGFDRIVFKGTLRPIAYVAGMQIFLQRNGVLNKDYKNWVTKQSSAIIETAEQYSREQSGMPIQYISSCHERKEELAHKRQKESGKENGLIGVWSCVEACTTYRSTYDAIAGYPQLRSDHSRCKHLYFYYDHPDYGFMSIRLQTWAPYGIQIALNGREWLHRLLDKEKSAYVIHGNKFLHLDDYDLAQRLLNSQLDTRWEKMLSGFVKEVFPTMTQTAGPEITYTWTLWQSEWAKDYVFESPEVLNACKDDFLRHALITGTCDRVLRYMGRPVKANGQPYPSANPELMTRISLWYDGLRIRHWVDENSLKLYNEQNVLRFEMTMNNPYAYRIYRHTEGKKEEPKKLLPMRKGIADISVRARISKERTDCFSEHMSTLTEKTPVGELMLPASSSFVKQGKKVRALDLLGKDREFLQAVSDLKWDVEAITNQALQTKLASSSWAKGMSGKRLSARISRHLRLLRDHGLIRKLPKQRKYILTAKGQKLTTALNAALAASSQDLLKLAA